MGTQSEPLTKDDKWKEVPMLLFAHNAMKHELYRGDPYGEQPETGVFGRLIDQLKLKGLHTSANNLNDDKLMLQGDSVYQNAIQDVQLGTPKDLNMYPTVGNLFQVAKQLNGVGELGNSFFAETFAGKFLIVLIAVSRFAQTLTSLFASERVSTALFEHEQMMAISEAGYEVLDYPLIADSVISSKLNAVANHILSRDFRKVNRDLYVVGIGGFDMHETNEVR